MKKRNFLYVGLLVLILVLVLMLSGKNRALRAQVLGLSQQAMASMQELNATKAMLNNIREKTAAVTKNTVQTSRELHFAKQTATQLKERIAALEAENESLKAGVA